jgi:hypothetical protein
MASPLVQSIHRQTTRAFDRVVDRSAMMLSSPGSKWIHSSTRQT